METGSSVLNFRFQLPYRPDGFPEQGSRPVLLHGLASFRERIGTFWDPVRLS
jgi:hypothetical protein